VNIKQALEMRLQNAFNKKFDYKVFFKINNASLAQKTKNHMFSLIKSRANTTKGLDYEHMIKVRAHREG
jgi:hypothetical protein